MSSPRRRIETDVMKLYINYYIRLMSEYEVNLINDNMQEFHILFLGPKESKYLY